MNINSTSKTSQNSHTSAPASASKPATQQQSKSEPPAAKQSSIQDSVSFSSEAEELAAVDPKVCNNDWRCLQALSERGLLLS